MNEDDGGKNIEGVDDVQGRLQMYFSKKPNPYKKKFHVIGCATPSTVDFIILNKYST